MKNMDSVNTDRSVKEYTTVRNVKIKELAKTKEAVLKGTQRVAVNLPLANADFKLNVLTTRRGRPR